MEIIKYIDLYIGALINFSFFLYIINRIFKISPHKNKYILILTILIISLSISIINIFNKDVFKIILIFPFSVIGVKNFFQINYRKSIIYSIVSNIYMFVGELILALILSILPFDYTFIFNNIAGTTIGAILVPLCTLPILCFKKITNMLNNFIDNINHEKQMFFAFIIITIIGAFSYKNSIDIENIFLLVSNIIIILAFGVVLYMCYLENIYSKEISKNYNYLFNYLEKYEHELIEKRKIIHDYKNQLIIINGYIGNDKKLKEYIKELMDEQRSIKENSIIKNIDKLPKGIKGLVYYKFSHISNEIIVDMQVKNKLLKFDNLNSKTNKDVLKIIGILIDNAIEAVIDEKIKHISLEFSLQKGIFKLKISNPCTKNVNIENLMNPGFSTKAKNRGYGLSIVKDISKQDKNIELDIKLVEEQFIAELQVKI